MHKVIKDPGRPITEQDILQLEKDYSITLPSDYKKFLLKYNGGRPYFDCYKLIEPIGGDSKLGQDAEIMRFYCLDNKDYNYDIRKTIFMFKEFAKRMPDELIPIGCGSGGDKICLCVKGKNCGKIYFWDHNWEAEEGEEPTYDNLYLIANSFTDFINSLYEYRPEGQEKEER